MKIITEQDIIAARQRVAAAEAAGEQQDFADALLASPDLTPEMVRQWLDAEVQVHWCACEDMDEKATIACERCGLPPFWTEVSKKEYAGAEAASQLAEPNGVYDAEQALIAAVKQQDTPDGH